VGELLEMFKRRTDGRCEKWLHYFDIYERHLARFRGKAASYLEIGVQRGGSLSLMHEYLGAGARITGIDIDPKCKALEAEGHRIFIGDQANAPFLRGVAGERGPFDIVIDDGGHTPQQQIVSFYALLPKVKPGGVYIVEDMHCAFWQDWQDSTYGVNFYDLAKGFVDKLSLWHLDRRLHDRYKLPPAKRKGKVGIPNWATRNIYSISFYDSIIVFERPAGPATEPYTERR
jgi:hypothetical protein